MTEAERAHRQSLVADCYFAGIRKPAEIRDHLAKNHIKVTAQTVRKDLEAVRADAHALMGGREAATRTMEEARLAVRNLAERSYGAAMSNPDDPDLRRMAATAYASVADGASMYLRSLPPEDPDDIPQPAVRCYPAMDSPFAFREFKGTLVRATPIRSPTSASLPPWPEDEARPAPGDWTWAPWYFQLHSRLLGRPYPTNIVLVGGRASGKSFAIADYAVTLAPTLTETDIILAIREIKSSSTATIKPTVEDVARLTGRARDFDFLGTETRCKTSGARIVYRGLNPQNPQTIEAIKGLRNVQLTICDEAQWISHRGHEILMNTVIREAGSQAVFALNPEDRNAVVQRYYVDAAEPPESTCIIRVNWDSNPYFTPESDRRRRSDQATQPDRYGYIWDGECAPDHTLGAIVSLDALDAAQDYWDTRPDPAGRILSVGVDLGARGHLSTAAATVVGGAIYDVTLVAVDDYIDFAGELWLTSKRLCAALGCQGVTISYDAAGEQGAAFRQAVDDIIRAQPAGALQAFGIHFGGRPAQPDRWYEDGATNGEVFANRSAQLATVPDLRCQNTIARVKGHATTPDRLLYLNPAITDVEGVKREFTQPRWKRAGGGRRAVQKEDKTVAASPHRWDALCLAMHLDSSYGLQAQEWTARTQDAA